MRILLTFCLLACLILGAISQRAAAQTPPYSDAELAIAVENALRLDEVVNQHTVDAAVSERIVTLHGETTSLRDKRRAERVARTVRGVSVVINEIDVRPPDRLEGRTDAAVAEDVRDALVTDAVTESWEVLVVGVEDGVVTLTGEVDSWREKLLVENAVADVAGVRDIENTIDVVVKTERPAGQIVEEVKAILQWDALVESGRVEVSADGDVVRLGGAVRSLAEKVRAATLAHVTGVRAVDIAELKVVPLPEAGEKRDDAPAASDALEVSRDPAETAAAVRRALVYEPRVAALDVEVAVADRTATLTGVVASAAARAAAERAARSVLGVQRVRNLLKVRAEIGDEAIRDAVERRLVLSPDVNVLEVEPAVEDGVVTLRGVVDTIYEKQQAELAASRARGVSRVRNLLDVGEDRQPYIHDPYIDEEWTVYDYDWFEYPVIATPLESDFEILDDIEDQLFWSPFVDSDDVNVAVADGVATLTGEVGSMAERRAATENALEGGAVRVVNNLDVAAMQQ